MRKENINKKPLLAGSLALIPFPGHVKIAVSASISERAEITSI
jgi:hypothetical protein